MSSMTAPTPEPFTKPLMRGVSHQFAFFVVLVLGPLLGLAASGTRATVATTVYTASLAAMFGCSALLHRGAWSRVVLPWMRRLDHSMIFVFMAGTYTPILVLTSLGSLGRWLLVAIWLAAFGGVLVTLFWLHAPRWVTTACYLAVGWASLIALPDLWMQLGVARIALLALGGLLFTAGAVVYARKRPDPVPEVFGYHEVFHLAAIISLTGDPTGIVGRVNVEGPHNAARAAIDAGVQRFVHCSSVHAYDLHTCGPSLDETGPRTTKAHAPVYDRTKYAGEQKIQAAIADGLDAVIVNPTGVFGPRDFAGSRIGETIQQLRSGKIPVTVSGGFDFVDVRDVVQGMISALERGRTGENYLLSGTRISIRELRQLVTAVDGSKRPAFDLPIGLVKSLAPIVELLTPKGEVPLFTRDSLHALEFSPTVSHYKAATELGYADRPIHVSVADTIHWMDSRRNETTEAHRVTSG